MIDASENIVQKSKLGIEEIRAKLSEKNGREYWRSLDDIAETEEFKELLEKEFPRETSAWSEGYNRRDFLKVMGASLSLAGLTACVKQPEEKIVPYVKAPELAVPGQPLHYATAFVMEGYATGVLARSDEGRPTGIEGNPDHPASLGAADIFATASLLNLYDPDRSQVVLRNNSVSSWENFVQAARLQLEVQRSLRGAGLRILTPNITSPTIGAQLQSILSEFPQAKWHQHEPCGTDNIREGTKAVFGEYLHPRYKFDKADVVLSLDGDIFASGPAHLRQARDFADRRRVLGKHADMNRLYLAESSPTVAATMADHRFRMKASEVEAFARNIAAELGVAGVTKANSPVDPTTVSAIVKDLQRHRGASIIFPGNYQSESVHALAHAMNAALGNIGATVEYTQPVEVLAVNHSQSLKE
ncbi:MAG: TAT-variant-translocated molybdopterin oxidoreductase, partial [bacterium]